MLRGMEVIERFGDNCALVHVTYKGIQGACMRDFVVRMAPFTFLSSSHRFD